MLSEVTTTKVQLFGPETISDLKLNCNRRIIDCVDRPNYITINSDESEILIGNEARVYFAECQAVELSSGVMSFKLANGDYLISLIIPNKLAEKAESFAKNFNNVLEASQQVEEVNLARSTVRAGLSEKLPDSYFDSAAVTDRRLMTESERINGFIRLIENYGGNTELAKELIEEFKGDLAEIQKQEEFKKTAEQEALLKSKPWKTKLLSFIKSLFPSNKNNS